ncbi:hypothetical protein ACSBR2_001822 [Camellia fascicularis]
MRKFTGDRELIRPAITRFATNFIAIESIVIYEQQLRDMFNSDEWKNSRWGKAKTGVLRLVDGDEKPTMGFIYEAIDRAKNFCHKCNMDL